MMYPSSYRALKTADHGEHKCVSPSMNYFLGSSGTDFDCKTITEPVSLVHISESAYFDPSGPFAACCYLQYVQKILNRKLRWAEAKMSGK